MPNIDDVPPEVLRAILLVIFEQWVDHADPSIFNVMRASRRCQDLVRASYGDITWPKSDGKDRSEQRKR